MKVLFVDDNKSVLSAFRRNLRNTYDVVTVESGDLALKELEKNEPFGIVVSDMRMPGLSGVEFLEKAIEVAPDTVRIMLTGNVDQETALDAVNRGHVYRFLNKPCGVDQIIEVLEGAAKQYEIGIVERKVLERTLVGCVKVMSDVLGLVAPLALGRGQRLRDCISPFIEFVNLKSVWVYEVAALLSGIGYTSLPSSLIKKVEAGDELNAREKALLREVPEIGYELVSDVPKLDMIARVIKYQEKRYDGGGFPEDEVSGSKIPLGSRILKIFEDRMALEREGVAGDTACEKMKGQSGVYDPKILDLCFKFYPEYMDTCISKKKAVKACQLADLEPGQTMVSNLCTGKGVLLVEAGNRMTAATIRRIRNYAALGQVDEPFYIQEEEE